MLHGAQHGGDDIVSDGELSVRHAGEGPGGLLGQDRVRPARQRRLSSAPVNFSWPRGGHPLKVGADHNTEIATFQSFMAVAFLDPREPQSGER